MEKQYTISDVIEIGEAGEMIRDKMGKFIDEDQYEFAGADVD